MNPDVLTQVTPQGALCPSNVTVQALIPRPPLPTLGEGEQWYARWLSPPSSPKLGEWRRQVKGHLNACMP